MSKNTQHNEEQEEMLEDVAEEPAVETQESEAPEEGKIVEQNLDYKDMAMRAQADYQNLQKQVREQRSGWAKMSELQILEEFIPIYNNFKTAFSHPVKEDDTAQWENWKKGIEYIKKQFGDVLTNHDVQEISTVGHLFDPNMHEAVSEEESGEHEDGFVIREVSGGYIVGDKVIQAARVVVCKKD